MSSGAISVPTSMSYLPAMALFDLLRATSRPQIKNMKGRFYQQEIIDTTSCLVRCLNPHQSAYAGFLSYLRFAQASNREPPLRQNSPT